MLGVADVHVEPPAARAGTGAGLPPTSRAHAGRALGPSQLRQLTAIPAAQDIVDSAVRLVVLLADATIAGADGVSVTLNRRGQLTTVAASDEVVEAMDVDQYETGEGPCVEATLTGQLAHAESLRDEDRWPEFTPRALAIGINAILSTPLLAGGRPMGALNVYARTANAFGELEQQLASSFGAHATTMLTDAGVGTDDREVSARLAAALRGREVIAQAEGVLMSRNHVSPSDAYSMMRRSAVSGGQPLAEVAAEVVASTQRPVPDRLLGPRG